MAYKTLELDLQSDVAVITISRPQALNALNADVLAELSQCAEALSVNNDIRAVIITGAGSKAFVAGADIKEMLGLDQQAAAELSKNGQEVFNRFEAMGKPVIAAVNGFALGGGFELALACDFIVASEKAKFGLPEVGLGLIPGYGGTQRLARAIGLNNARYVAMTANMFTAQDLYNWGAVSEVVAPEQLMVRALELAKMMATKGPIAVGLVKQAVQQGYDQTLKAGLTIEAESFAKTFSTEDSKEGILAFTEKRKANFKGK